ncbi:MAG: ABC transporter ATP-binding protein [Vallitaleaceae bacterium]|nr:ABC transporter ATP-binding protein [Vallitaleaceae bacterium]
MFVLEHVRYKNILALDHLHIKEHHITSILGESGSGKSTLLRLLNKLISCDQGQIRFQGQDIKTLSSIELRREVVMLPQLPIIYPGNIRENLQLGLRFSEKAPAHESQLYEMLDFVNLNKELSQDAQKLSGGEKQRLALARVLLLEPKVFLLDEPSSALDEDNEKLIIEKMVSYCRNHHKTLVLVTHSKQIALNYSDSIIEMSQGRLKAQTQLP